MKNKQVSILILDYSRPKEGRVLLESLKKHLKIDVEIVYLVNGAKEKDEYEYAFDFYREELIDNLIIHKYGNGGGFGHTDLFKYCRTKYAFFVQVDHELVLDITQKEIDFFISLLNDYKMVDLAGNQGNGVYSDRTNFWRVSDFNHLCVSIFAGGGPGCMDGKLRWNENYLQEEFKNNNYKIAHINPLFFADKGCYSYRENLDGSKWVHRTDTKELKLIKGPIKDIVDYPKFSSQEWENVLRTQTWQEWGIPELEKPHSFQYFQHSEKTL